MIFSYEVMRRAYSRLAKIEERKNIRKAIVFTILTLFSILAVIFFGLPIIAKFAIFFSGLKKSSQPVDKNDITPPSPPQIDVLPETTNKNPIEISGSSEAGTAVSLFLNDKKEELIANKEGRFSFTFKLKDGLNTISATSKDLSGNESQKTETMMITLDVSPPSLEIESPKDGESFFGSKKSQVIIRGKSEEGVSVTVNDRIALVDDQGNFTLTTSLAEGVNIYSIKAQDRAQNTTEKTLTLTFGN